VFGTSIHWIAGLEPHRIGLMACPRGGARGFAMPDTTAQIEWGEQFLADTRP
jgi:hypothetical protein